MTPAQQEALNRAIIDVLTDKGTPVADDPSVYGWMHRDYDGLRIHMAHCRPAYQLCHWEDSSWTEFVGTEYPDEYRKGIDAVVTCRCGTVSQRRWRYTGGHAELLRAITG